MNTTVVRRSAAGPTSTPRPGSAPPPLAVELPGLDGVWLHPSVEAEARGWAAAMTGEFRVEERKTGRGERSQDDDFDHGARHSGRPVRSSPFG
jgi:hypothetical protein